MKTFNLFKEIIVSDKTEILKAVNSAKTFGLDIKGNIKYAPFLDDDIFIFIGKHTPQPITALKPQQAFSLEEFFGKNYQVVEDDERVLIKAFSNWQEIIGFNLPRATYDDSTGDGVSEFSYEFLEDIGWNATEFNINYREIVEFLEENCEGTLICIEQNEPYQFSGLGFLNDKEQATKALFNYCQEKISTLMENDDDYKQENLTDDEIEAATFFKLL